MIMKRLLTCLVALCLGLFLFAQGQVTTRKHRLSDFTDKLTLVVLTGNEFLTGALRQEIVNNWTTSAFEFCTPDQFEQRKTSDKFYFLIPVEGQFKGEDQPGLLFLTLVKGGKEASEGIDKMHEVITLPLASAGGGNVRDLVYLGGIVQAIQDFTLAAMESETAAYSMGKWFSGQLGKSLKDKQIYLAKEELSSSLSAKDLNKLNAQDNLHLLSADEVDDLYVSRTPDALTGYVVTPLIPEDGAYCYKLVFEADSHRLCYLERHKIGPKKGEGFLSDDLKRLSR